MNDILELVGMAEVRRRADAYPALVAALKEIAKGEGPCDQDPLLHLFHALNTIDAMKKLASDALGMAKRGPV